MGDKKLFCQRDLQGSLNLPKDSHGKSILPGTEGPIFFKHGDNYYITQGSGCCACKGGSSIYVFTATAPLWLGLLGCWAY